MKLDSLTVRRALPVLHSASDRELFEAELQKDFAAVETSVVSGDFLSPGWHRDLPGWKGQLRGGWLRLTSQASAFVPQPGRRPVIATDRFSNGYFHWVAEVLPRLWWLRSSHAELELLLPAFASRFPYMTESLAVFPELAWRVLPEGERWRVKDVLLVPAPAPTGNYRPELVLGLAQAWRQRIGTTAPFRKVYISRARAARRRVSNEAELRQHLEAQGFETIYLEGMPFAEQVRLLSETATLIANHGAGLTNLMFMQPGTRVTEIRLQGDTHNNCYFSLARAVGVEYHYVLANPVNRGEGAHTADVRVPLGQLP